MPKQHLILGGSFDPVHNGHLALGRALTNLFPNAELRIIPNYQSPLKHQTHASAKHRLAMLKLATADMPNTIIDTYELDQQQPVYTIDTLEHLHQQYPNDQLILVLGSDLIEHFEQWHRWRDILLLASVLVVQRQGWPELTQHTVVKNFGFTSVLDKQNQVLTTNGKIKRIDLDLPRISSSLVREAIRGKYATSGSLPTIIADYIRTHSLYTGGS